MAYVTRNRSGGCGCRQAALRSGLTYANNYNYSSGCSSCGCNSCGSARSGSCGCNSGCNSCGNSRSGSSCGCSNCSSCDDTWPYYSGSCPSTAQVNGCPGFCRLSNGLPCGYFSNNNCSNNCGCDDCCDDCDDCDCDTCTAATALAHGFFSHSCELNLAAGCSVPFSGASYSRGMTQDSNQIRVHRSGVYLIAYHLTLPVDEDSPEARFYLTADGERENGSDVRFYNTDAGQVHSVSGQAIVRLRARSAISLVSDTGMRITPRDERDTLATITLIRIR